ncbi:MAG: LTA synthase family protein [Chitinophagaceae bacterium]|nr:MAG: LTA synthase family protein [Chitinophagaceae bacterium]
MTNKTSRYSIVAAFYIIFIGLSFLVRTGLVFWSAGKADLGFTGLLKIYFLGLLYDIIVASCFMIGYSFYLLLLPARLNRSLFNKILTISFVCLAMLIILFSSLAEITFWQEFESRFNFIAVDYLIYTYEVINNINESYPLPLLISVVMLLLLILLWLLHKLHIFQRSFNSNTSFKRRILYTSLVVSVGLGGLLLFRNGWADEGSNRYTNELSKAGIFSFFAAFKNNELNYDHFYRLINIDTSFNIVHEQLAEKNARFSGNSRSFNRFISDSGTVQKPNVIMVTIESLSADYLGSFGNQNGLTPVLDSLASKGISFKDMYATGTRTVRGMEALSLAVPPTPGSSIVRRPDNGNLTTVGSIFEEAGYESNFIYGGDGYFDNMNQYFGSNGYDIVDHGRNMLVKDKFAARRTGIPGNKIHFQNAWGVCDEDLYDAVISNADSLYAMNKLFYNFVMTTSNHRPFTFPEGRIKFPAGTRNAAVAYTDYAIGQFLKNASGKPWYNNTVFIFVADHCASSAGKNEIDISKYHIPCIIYQPAAPVAMTINKQCSQIDLYPTLFGLFNWNYKSNLYGTNVLDSNYKSRVLLGTYQKLVYLSNDSMVILSPQQKVETYLYNEHANIQTPVAFDKKVVDKAIAFYETAYYLFKNGGLKQ